MSYSFQEYNQDQLLLMPPSVREWMEEDSMACFVSEVVDGFDAQGGWPPSTPRTSLGSSVWTFSRISLRYRSSFPFSGRSSRPGASMTVHAISSMRVTYGITCGVKGSRWKTGARMPKTSLWPVSSGAEHDFEAETVALCARNGVQVLPAYLPAPPPGVYGSIRGQSLQVLHRRRRFRT
jgi:hypothetical protein